MLLECRQIWIGLFVLLECRQIWILSNIFLRQFPSPDLCPMHHSGDHEDWREESTNNTNPWNLSVPYTVQFIGLFWFILLLYKFILSKNFGNQFFCKKKYCKKWSRDLQISDNYIFSLNLKSVFNTSILCWMVFCIFQIYLLHYRMPLMCLEPHKIRHFRCIQYHL